MFSEPDDMMEMFYDNLKVCLYILYIDNITASMVEVCVAANAPELRNRRWSAGNCWALGRTCDWPDDFLWQICCFPDGILVNPPVKASTPN